MSAINEQNAPKWGVEIEKAPAFLLGLIIWSDTRGSLSFEHQRDLNLGKVALYQLMPLFTGTDVHQKPKSPSISARACNLERHTRFAFF